MVSVSGNVRRTRQSLLVFGIVCSLVACATAPQAPSDIPVADSNTPDLVITDTTPAPPQIDPFTTPPVPVPRPTLFENLPGWDAAELDAPIAAFKRSCAAWETRSNDAPVSKRIAYAGTIGDWRPACGALDVASDSESARRVFEALFTPVEVLPGADAPRFTGYFEPEIEARRRPEFPFTQPIPARPRDLVQIDGRRIGKSSSRTVPAQRLPNGNLKAYPARADIALKPEDILGYGHPADVFFLQIQGSGRLIFEDGRVVRAAFAAHNGHPFRSTANHLIRTGQIKRSEASMQGIRAWMDRVSRADAEAAMNANPRFVFFKALAIGDPGLGPAGAQGLPLTPLGSMAVDTDIHPLGVPFFVETTAPGLGGDWSGLLIAQDTGGAIKGRVRGDIYYGTGSDAGRRAGTQNAPGRMWAFLPRALAARLEQQDSPIS